MRSLFLSMALASVAFAETFGGFGITIQQSPLGVQVVTVIPGTVADGNFKAGDQIMSVGEQSLQGISLETATSLLRGEVGTYAQLTVKSQDGSVWSKDLPRIGFNVEDLDAQQLKSWYEGSVTQITPVEVQAFAEAKANTGFELKGVLQYGQLLEGENEVALQEVKGVYVGAIPSETPKIAAQLTSGFDLLAFDAKGLTLELKGTASGVVQVLDAQGKLMARWNVNEGSTGVQMFQWENGKAPVNGVYSIRVRQGSQQGAWQASLR